jgi:predicted GNAT family N-acyltransferase
MSLKITPLDSRVHIRSNFQCGKESLDHYIQKQASQDIKKRVSTAFVLTDDPSTEILAYYTLSAYTIEIKSLDEAFTKRLPRYPLLPATLLGRLAVDDRQKGKGFGGLMLFDSLKKSLDTSIQVASIAVVAEALDEVALKFYLKYGFKQFQHEPMKLYLSMESIKQIDFGG